MIIGLCYKTAVPVVYNRGTKYETTCDCFLAYHAGYDLEAVQAEADRINREKPEKLRTGEPALCNERFYFAQESREFY